jgi:sRNA-binding protein
VIVLRRGSSSKKEKVKEDVTDKKAAKKQAAEEKAAQKKAAKEQAAEEKAAKKAAKTKPAKEPRVKAPRAEVGGDAPRGVLVRRPKTSIYSVMLGISAGALAIGCLVLVLEIWTYGAPWTFPWNIPINLR